MVSSIRTNNVFAQSTTLSASQQQVLQNELNQVEAQIAAQQTILDQAEQQGVSIQRDIAILDAEISKAQLEIKAHDIAIQNLGTDIDTKSTTINSLSDQIDQTKQSIADNIRQLNDLDAISLVSILLANNNITDYLSDYNNFNTLNGSIATLVNQSQSDENSAQTAKQALTDQQNQEIALKLNVQSEEDSIKQAESQKENLLSLNESEQKNYQSIIATQQTKAAQIRAALFALRDATAIDFGTAVTYAEAAEAKTGVRPAFLLAIITQESNLGQNIGSCYISGTDGNGVDIKTGDYVSGVMKATRDVQPFIALMNQLGRDPYKTPVSCPLNIGYGGGMGPSQFIPSTWQLLEPDIARYTNKSVPDPFNAQDAFMASAIYLSNLGASGGSATAERNAACKYYSGKSCTTNSFNGFYGNDVMTIAAGIQSNINLIESN